MPAPQSSLSASACFAVSSSFSPTLAAGGNSAPSSAEVENIWRAFAKELTSRKWFAFLFDRPFTGRFMFVSKGSPQIRNWGNFSPRRPLS